MGSRSAMEFRLPGDIPDMGLLRDGTPFAGISEIYAVVGGRYPAGTPLFMVEVEGMASVGAVVQLLAAFDCMVESVLVLAGQWVRAGQVLAELRPIGQCDAVSGELDVAVCIASPWSPLLGQVRIP